MEGFCAALALIAGGCSVILGPLSELLLSCNDIDDTASVFSARVLLMSLQDGFGEE